MKRVIYGLIIVLSIFISTNSIKAWSEYKIGDKVTYNDIDFYVIKDSGSEEGSVTMLKKEPLTVEEADLYLEHISANISSYDCNGYAGIYFYTNDDCKPGNFTVCETDYSNSFVKNVVDEWAKEKINNNDMIADELGYTSRLITINELENLGYIKSYCSDRYCYPKNENVPSWLYNDNFFIWWTMNEYNSIDVWSVNNGYSGGVYGSPVSNNSTVRPVITLSKTALGDIDESNKEEKITNNESNNNINNIEDNNKTSINVKVENTYLSQSLIIMILGFIISCISVIFYYIIRKKEGK